MRDSMSKRDANALSVRVELQADCFAGVWANRRRHASTVAQTSTDKDIEQALAAATAIGDDTLQRQARAASCPTASRTAPAPSACAGSASASTAAI